MVDYRSGLYGFDQLHGFASVKTDTSGLLIEGIHANSDGFKTLNSNAPTGFSKSEIMLKFEHMLTANHQLKFKLSTATETSHETYLGLTKAIGGKPTRINYASSANGLMTWNRGLIQAEWLAFLSPNTSLRTVAYGHFLNRSWNKLNRFNNSSINIHDLLVRSLRVAKGPCIWTFFKEKKTLHRILKLFKLAPTTVSL